MNGCTLLCTESGLKRSRTFFENKNLSIAKKVFSRSAIAKNPATAFFMTGAVRNIAEKLGATAGCAGSRHVFGRTSVKFVLLTTF